MKLLALHRVEVSHSERNMYGVDVRVAHYPEKFEICSPVGDPFPPETFKTHKEFLDRVRELKAQGHEVE